MQEQESGGSAGMTLWRGKLRIFGRSRKSIRDRAAIENPSAGIVCATEFAADFACRFAHAVFAAAVGLTRQTRKRRQRPLKNPQNFAKTDGIRRPQHNIAAALPPATVQYSRFLQVEQNLLQKLVRDR